MPETIELKLGNGTLSIQIPKNEIFRLDAIFKEQEYAIADPGPVHSVVDIGANIGLTAIYFKILYPTARICCFEPCLSSFDMLEHNIARLQDVRAFHLALADYDGEATLHIHKDNSGQNSLTNDGAAFTEHKKVPVKDAYSLFQKMDITTLEILKIDTEGSELPILRSLEPMLGHVRHILVETHGLEDRRAIEALLRHTHTLARDASHAEGFGVLQFRRKD
ncbi:FkbM family methyltransferase [Solidesulfovibrio sp. C21]|uniref:FkbM family methyltransferase n=1 Tax=Solidesulfovibrio sp. C21 TaxID=3398613 RepID=UPI0039FDDB88